MNYHSDYSAVSRSMLSVFRESRREYELRYIKNEAPPEEPKEQMKLGSLAHCMLLTPGKLKDEFAVIPESFLSTGESVRTNEAKRWVWETTEAGRTTIKPSQWKESERIVDNIKKTIGKWIDKAEAIEQPIYWTDTLTGIKCKAKPDFIVPAELGGEACKIIIDVKTTLRIIPHTFSRRFEDGGYWLQEAHYRQGVFETTGIEAIFYFPAIEQRWPYRCAVFQMRPAHQRRAFEIWRETMNCLASCMENGNFSDPWDHEITNIDLRDWIFREQSF